MTYVDGFVFVLKKSKIGAYKKMASDAGKIWKKFGALKYVECIGDDLHQKSPDPSMKPLYFTKLTKVKAGETVGFSFITYKNKAHRDSVNKKVMKYMEEKYKDATFTDMPFDMKRMSSGGFKPIVEY
ncbi:MAG: DUF1428 domain-containing protein [Candidatus Pacearchaeota archaeon]